LGSAASFPVFPLAVGHPGAGFGRPVVPIRLSNDMNVIHVGWSGSSLLEVK